MKAQSISYTNFQRAPAAVRSSELINTNYKGRDPLKALKDNDNDNNNNENFLRVLFKVKTLRYSFCCCMQHFLPRVMLFPSTQALVSTSNTVPVRHGKMVPRCLLHERYWKTFRVAYLPSGLSSHGLGASSTLGARSKRRESSA